MPDTLSSFAENSSADTPAQRWQAETAATAMAFDGDGVLWLGFANGSLGYIAPGKPLVTFNTDNSVILCLEGLVQGCITAGDSGTIARCDAAGHLAPIARTNGWTDFLQWDHKTGFGFAASARGLSAFKLDGASGDGKSEDGASGWASNSLPGSPTGLALRHDGNQVAISHRQGFTIFHKNGHVASEHNLRGVIRSLAWRPDGRYLCGTIQEGDVMLWQPADDGEGLLASQWGYLGQTCWSANSRWLAAAAGSTVVLWSFADRAMPGDAALTLEVPDGRRVTQLKWHPHLSTLAIGTNRGDVCIWAELSSRRWQMTRPTDSGSLDVFQWSPDGTTLVAAFASGEIAMFRGG